MQRVIILEGVNATGKTTVAYKLQERLGGVVIHQPSLTWWGKLCRKYKKQWMFDLDRFIQKLYVKTLTGVIIYVRSPLSKYVYESEVKDWRKDWYWFVKDLNWELVYLYADSKELTRRIDCREDKRTFTIEELELCLSRYEEVLENLPHLRINDKVEETVNQILLKLLQE
jgi:thymidylate kinase